MGFFDGMKAIFDPKRWYTEPRLYEYFHYEVKGTDNPEGFKYSVTTNIRRIIDDYTKDYFPEADVNKTKIEHVWEFTGTLEKCDEENYRIAYIGKIKAYNVYNDYEGELYYRVVVYTNKYAELSKKDGQKTQVTVSKNPIKLD